MSKTPDESTIVMMDVYTWDYPDFSDASIESMQYEDGTPMTSDEIEAYMEANSCIVNEKAHESLQ